MSREGSFFWRAALAVAGATAVSAAGSAWLLHGVAAPRQLLLMVALQAAAAAAALGALVSMGRALRRTRSEVIEQIEAAGQGRLEERVQSGAVEWIPLQHALNVMVVRLKLQFEDRDRRLGVLQTEVSVDELTGLAAREQFIERLSAMLHEPDVGAIGGVLLLRIDDLGGVNQRIGRDRTDELLKSVATLLRTRLPRLASEGGVVARLNGADFALAAPRVTPDRMDRFARELTEALHGLRQRELTDRPRVGWIAAGIFHPGESPGAVLSRVDRALQSGEAANMPWQMVRAARSGPAISLAQWRNLLDEAMSTGRIELVLADIMAGAGRLHHRLALLRLPHDDGRVLDHDEISAAALRTGRTADVDLRAAELCLALLAAGEGEIALRISPRSAERPGFVSRLDIALADAGDVARRLRLELDTSVEQDVVGVLATLAHTLQKHGVRLGLDHVSVPPENLAPLRRLGVAYLRLAPRMAGALDGEGSAGKRLLLQLMAEIGETEGMELVAGPADTTTDAKVLHDLGIACGVPASGRERAAVPAAQASTPAVTVIPLKTTEQRDGQQQ